jgi:hypothetical protein
MKRIFAGIMVVILCLSMFVPLVTKVKADSTVPTVVSASVSESSSSITLLGGADIYLYGYGTGGGLPSYNFNYGQITSLTNQGGYLVAALALTTSNTNSFSTYSEYPVIGGCGVNGFSSYTYTYGSNNSPAAPSASDSFTVTASGSLVVVIAIGGDEQSLTVSGLPNLQSDAAWPGSPWNSLEILHTYLDAGSYTVTEYTSQSAAGQTPAYAGDLIGVFVFAPALPSSGPVISSVSPIAATRLQTITISGSGFGNTWPQTTPVGDGSVDTVKSATTPYMDIVDRGKFQKTGDSSDGGENWAAGLTAPGLFCMVGIYIVSWSDNEIVLGGFGTYLGTNGQGQWYIEQGDPLNINVYTSSGEASYYTTVVAIPSSVSVSCSPNPASTGSPVTCTATVTGSGPTGTVTWSSSSSTSSFSPSTCTLSSGTCSTTYTDTNAGSVTITASYTGNANNAPSSGSTTLTLLHTSSAEFNMHWETIYYGVTAGETTSFTIYLDYSPGFTGLVTLSFQGLPPGCTASFDIAGAQAPSVHYRTLSVTTPSTLNNGTYTFYIEGESDGVFQTIPVTLTVGTGEITGIVYRDDNQNGIKDPGEPAVSGATIAYYATQNYMNVYQTAVTSDSNGEFTLINVPFNVDNEIDVSATGLSSKFIYINIMNQPETQLNIGLSVSLASSWEACPDFSIAYSSVSFSQYLLPFAEAYNDIPLVSKISIDSINSLPPVNLYMITQSSSADQAEFAQSLSQFLGITTPTGYNPACVWIFEFPFLQTVNALFGSTIQGPITIPIPFSGGVNLILSAQSISTTPEGSLVLAFTFSKVADNSQGILDTLQAIAKDLVSLAKEPNLQAIVTTGVDILNSITEALGDASVNVITSDLNQIGQLNSYTLLDIVHVANTLSTLATAGGILMKTIDLLCPGTEAAATGGLDLPADVQTIVHVLDLGLEILPYLPGMSFLNDNTLYQLFMTGESQIISIVDPNGSEIIPSVYDMNGSLMLGYNFTSGGIIYASSEGILMPAAGDWLLLLNESTGNPANYTICLTAIGGNATVPYNLQILSSNQNVTTIGYSGMLIGGTSTIIPVSVAPDGTLIQQVYLNPTLSASETGNVYDFVATGTLSNSSLASVTNAFLIINGSEYDMIQDNSSTFEIHTLVNLPGNVTYFVYMISPDLPGGFASGVLTQCNITFDKTGVGSDFLGTIVNIDGLNYNISTLPASFWWYNGSTHSFAFQSPLPVGSGAKLYYWNSTTGLSSSQSGSFTVSGSGSVTGNYVTKVHDVAVTGVVATVPHCSNSTKIGNGSWVYQGFPVYVNVTVWNNGDFNETVNVTLYYNMTADEIVGTQNITIVAGENGTVSFVWETTGVPYNQNYALTAVAMISPADYTPADNTLAAGSITVRIPGDINGDGKVGGDDLIIIARSFGAYGPNFVYPGSPPSPRWNLDADIAGDNRVDGEDLILAARNFGK